jgi:hypothetical protein
MDAYDTKTVYQTQRGWERCVLANKLATISRLLLLWWRWMGGRRRRPTNTVKLTIFPVTLYPWQGRYNNRCVVRGVCGAWCVWCIVHFAWCIERGALGGGGGGGQQTLSNWLSFWWHRFRTSWTAADANAYIFGAVINYDWFYKVLHYYYCCDYNEWGGRRRRPTIGGSPKKCLFFK